MSSPLTKPKNCEQQLDVIYDLVPPCVHECYSAGFGKRHDELTEEVLDKFGDRHAVLKRQHEIALHLLPHLFTLCRRPRQVV